MDRTQYGKVTLSDTYRPYDIILKRKPLPGYALLADLQTNLNKVNSHPASSLHHTHTTTPQYQQQYHPSTVTTVQTSVKSYTPRNEESNTRIIQIEQQQERPTYSNANDITSRSEQQHHQHIYQNDDLHKQQNGFQVRHSPVPQVTSVERSINSVESSSVPHHNYENALPPKDQMYRHETREEVRTETRSSGPNPTPQRSTISNNLSELDSLLHDLNTTKHNSVIKESKVVNGNRPSVDSLLDELNSVGHRTESSEKRTTLQETRTTHSPPSTYPLKVSHVSASNATKELDDLMESLSDFKGVSQTSKIETKVYEGNTKQKTAQCKTEQRLSGRQDYDAPPRPPSPSEIDAFPVPPPRPPAPVVVYSPPDISVPSVLPTPIVPSPTPGTVSIIYTQPDQPQHRVRQVENLIDETSEIDGSCISKRYCYISHGSPPDSLVEDAFVRPESGGPVKRNDAEYRWVTDQIKHEIREVIERPSSPPQVEPKIKVNRINASSLQSQVDNAYAKPLPKRLSPPPPPKPQPKPAPPPNQLDSMLGSLTSHMTEQGINTSQKGCCCACDKPIVGQVITALGKTWHPEHFVCAHCKEELGTKNFFERDGKPYCEPDYHNLFSPKCAYCSGPILDKCVTAMNKTWHPEHFFCAQCGNTFGEEGFHEKNGKPYCKDDYFNMFAPKCGGCNNPIMENYISALNSQWHPECFVCRDCNQPFNGGSFFDHEGLPYCETHYHAKRGSLCAACNKPITGRCITAMFRKYHPEHFLCAFCLQQLNKGTFKEQNNKPYCHTCFDKLYG